MHAVFPERNSTANCCSHPCEKKYRSYFREVKCQTHHKFFENKKKLIKLLGLSEKVSKRNGSLQSEIEIEKM